MLLDSNIVIYAARPEHVSLRRFIAERAPSVSVISQIEVLGFHRLADAERQLLERFFEAAEVLPLTDSVVQQAVLLRRSSLGGSGAPASRRGYEHRLLGAAPRTQPLRRNHRPL